MVKQKNILKLKIRLTFFSQHKIYYFIEIDYIINTQCDSYTSVMILAT